MTPQGSGGWTSAKMEIRGGVGGVGRLKTSLLLVQVVPSVEGPGLGQGYGCRLAAGGHGVGNDARPRTGGEGAHGRESLMKIESVGPIEGAKIFPRSAWRATMFGGLTQL